MLKLKNLLDGVIELNRPLDLLLRDKVRDGSLNAMFTIPFLSSISHHAISSQIQGKHMEPGVDILDLMRNAFWIHYDYKDQIEQLTALSRKISPEAKAFGLALAALVDQRNAQRP